MTAKKTHEELVELLQAGKIGFLRFVMDGENAEDYLEWCQTARLLSIRAIFFVYYFAFLRKYVFFCTN